MKNKTLFYSLFIFIISVYFAMSFSCRAFASDNSLITMIQDYSVNSNFSNRLIVETSENIDCEGTVAFVRDDNVYYLQYATEEETREAYEYYNSLSYVEAVAYDVTLKEDSTLNGELYFYTWGAEKIGADTYNEYLRSNIGEDNTNDIIIAVLDSGIDTDHPWFANRIESGGINFSSSTSSTSYAYEDVRGHGTHASGIIVDLTLSNVKILPVKVLNDEGEGATSSILKGIEYVIDLKKDGKNIVAMNMSFGADGISVNSYWHQKYTTAIEEAYNLGILSIISSGNDGVDCSTYLPANVSKGITIGAVEKSGNTVVRSYYSNYGRYVDYTAPGTYIYSAQVGGGVIDKSGTSMAAPHVTGVVALLKSDSIINYSNSEIESILREKVIDLGSGGFDNYYGYGMINIKDVGVEKIDDVNFSVTNLSHSKAFELELTSNEPNALIYYTLDGSEPTSDNGILYTSKIYISSSKTVKAKAYVFKNGHISKCSDIKSYTYAFSYSITVTTYGSGSADAQGESWYEEGTSKKIMFYPNFDSYISELKIDGVKLTENEIALALLNGYEFKNISSNHTIEVIFQKKIYTITSSSEGSGDISPKGSVTIEHGNNQKYLLVFSEGSYVEELLIDGIKQSRDIIEDAMENGYFFDNVDAHHTIHVIYKIIKHNIIVYKEGLSSGILSDIIIVDYGDNKTYLFDQYEGYHIKQIKINGNTLSYEEMTAAIRRGYIFYNIKNDYTLNIKYEIAVYTIVSSSKGMAGISPNGEVKVTYNSSQKYEFRVISGYYISQILVDGMALDDNELKTAITNGYTFTDIKSDHTIEVEAKLITYKLNVSVSGSGLVTPSGSVLEYKEGTTKTLRFTPSIGSYLDKIIIDEEEFSKQELLDAIENGYTFENLSSDHDIQVVFKVYTYKIESKSNDFGTITPNGETIVEYGQDQTYQFIANPGYHIKELIIDGQTINQAITNSYTFDNVQNDHTIEVIYEINKYTITSSVEGEGSITPLGEKQLNYGESQTYNLSITEGYYVDKIIIDNFMITDNEIQNIINNGYIFSNIFNNHTIHVSYKIKTFNITKEVVGTGSVTIENNGQVNYGGSLKLNIEDAEGFVLSQFYIDNQLVDLKYEYLFENVKENHSVKVVFVELFVFDIAIESGGNVTTQQKTTKGEDVTYYFSPKEGYFIKNVYIDGVDCGSISQYTFYSIDKAHSIQVIYEIKVYEIIVRTIGNGYATSEKDLKKVEYGDTRVINLKPDEKHEVNYVLVNEKDFEFKDGKVYLEKITSDLEVVISFKEKGTSPIILYGVIGIGCISLLLILLKFRKLRRTY